MSMIKLVIFDVDGTLVDSETVYVKAALKNLEVNYMVFGDEIKNSKPAPDIYLKVFEHYNYDKDEMIICEDSKNGILSAHNAGIRVVYIKDIVDVNEDTLALCYKQVKDLDEGIEILRWTLNHWHIALDPNH